MKFNAAAFFIDGGKYPKTFKYLKGAIDELEINAMRVIFGVLCCKALVYAAIFNMDRGFRYLIISFNNLRASAPRKK